MKKKKSTRVLEWRRVNTVFFMALTIYIPVDGISIIFHSDPSHPRNVSDLQNQLQLPFPYINYAACSQHEWPSQYYRNVSIFADIHYHKICREDKMFPSSQPWSQYVLLLNNYSIVSTCIVWNLNEKEN